MEILGIGPGEFIFILIIMLVVVGPERLPDLARQAGKLLVRGRNWLQSSPDAAMVMRARQEIEQELANLKTSLLEVQSVRDEVLDAAKQIGDSVGSLTSAAKAELDDIGTIGLRKPSNPLQDLEDTLTSAHGQPDAALDATIARNGELAPEPTIAQGALDMPDLPPAPDALDAIDAPPEPPVLGLPKRRQPIAYVDEPNEPAAADVGVLESIDLRLQAIMSDMFALQEQLKQRGALAEDWQPPSWGMHLPAELPPENLGAPATLPEAPPEPMAQYDAPSMPAAPIETEEAPNV